MKKRADDEKEKRMKNNSFELLLSKANDDYDLIAAIGKIMNEYNISTEAKDAIKDIVRGSISFGYKMCENELKKGVIS